MTDISDVITEISVPLEIVRSLPPDMVKGRVQGVPRERTIKVRAAVQPMPTKELMFLPEGMRNQGCVKVFTKELLHTVDTSDGRIPDRFTYRAVEYEVAKVDDWADVAGYYRVLAVRLTR